MTTSNCCAEDHALTPATISATTTQNYFFTANFHQILATPERATHIIKILNMNFPRRIIVKNAIPIFNLQANLNTSHYFNEVALDFLVSIHC